MIKVINLMRNKEEVIRFHLARYISQQGKYIATMDLNLEADRCTAFFYGNY